MKIDRLIGIIMLLNNRGKMTAAELAEKYEVSAKTIQRDMDAINMAGIPIVSHRGQDGGYEILNSYRLNNSVLTRNDVSLINALIDGLQKSCSFPLLAELREKFVVLDRQESHVQRLAIDFSAWRENSSTKEKMKIIERSFSESRTIDFHYTNLQGNSGPRRVEPLQMVFKSNHWYLYGWCKDKAAYRFFKIRRMKDIQLGEAAAKRELMPEEFDQTPMVDVAEIRLRVTPDLLRRADDYFDSYTVEGDVLTLHWPLDEWVYSLLLGLGPKAEVLSPLSLREQIKKRIDEMKNLYQ